MGKFFRRIMAASVAALLLGQSVGLLSPRPSAVFAETPAVASVYIQGVPHIRQEPDFCGEACAAMYLNKLGQNYDQDAVFNAAGLDPALARGCWARDLNAALTKIGFRTGVVWY